MSRKKVRNVRPIAEYQLAELAWRVLFKHGQKTKSTGFKGVMDRRAGTTKTITSGSKMLTPGSS